MLTFRKSQKMYSIAGFPSYSLVIDEASGEPRVWSEKRKRFLKPRVVGRGYHQFGLSNRGEKQAWMLLHRIVAVALIPNPENHYSVDHINGDKLDNRVKNLRWADRSTQERNKSGTKGYYWHKARNLSLIHI